MNPQNRLWHVALGVLLIIIASIGTADAHPQADGDVVGTPVKFTAVVIADISSPQPNALFFTPPMGTITITIASEGTASVQATGAATEAHTFSGFMRLYVDDIFNMVDDDDWGPTQIAAGKTTTLGVIHKVLKGTEYTDPGKATPLTRGQWSRAATL